MIQLSKIFKVLQRYPNLLQTYQKFTSLQTQIINRSLSNRHHNHLANTCHAFRRVRNGVQELYKGEQQVQKVLKYFKEKGFDIQYKNDWIGLMRQVKKFRANEHTVSQQFSIMGYSNKSTQINKSQQKDIEEQAQEYYKLRFKVTTIPVQKRDLPCFRDSLYFSQLKDAHKYLTIPGVHPATPNFMKDIMWKSLQQMKLDKKNPLGLPIHAPPMQIEIFFRKLWLKLRVHLNDISIQEFGTDLSGQKIQQIIINSPKMLQRMSNQMIDQQIQQAVFKFVKQQLRVDQDFVLMLHKLAYIGGHVDQIAFLMDFFQLLLLWKQDLRKTNQNGQRLF